MEGEVHHLGLRPKYGCVFLNEPSLTWCLQNTAIDFSSGEVQSDGSVCVVREEEQDRVEQGKEEQCTQQNVTQCYNSYVTTYRDVVKERCQDVFVKTCRIVLRQRAYNATTRVCKRPLVKECSQPVRSSLLGHPVNSCVQLPSYGAPETGYGAPNTGYGAPNTGYGAPDAGYGVLNAGYGAPNAGYGVLNVGYGAPNAGYGTPNVGYGAPNAGYGAPNAGYGAPEPGAEQAEPNIVCRNMYETQCNTTHQVCNCKSKSVISRSPALERHLSLCHLSVISSF